MTTYLSFDCMPIRGISYYSTSICIFVRLMRTLSVRTYSNRTVWKVVFMDVERNEILGVMMDKEIDRWKVILKMGRVHRLSGFAVSTATPKDKEIVDNNLKLLFTHKTQLLDLLDEYHVIPCHHLPPFVPFVDVSAHLQPNAQTIDIIGLVVAVSETENTRAGTLKRDVLLCDMQLNALKLTLWGDFAEIEGNHLSRHLLFENVLLASRLFVRGYKGLTLSTTPRSRLLINPPIEHTSEFEGWWADDGHAQRRLQFIRRRILRIPTLEKLFVARRITLTEYSPLHNVSYYRIFAYVENIFPIVYASCPDCHLCSRNHVFDLSIPYCTCPHPQDATSQRFFFKVDLRDSSSTRTFTVLQDVAAILLHTTTNVLSGYAAMPQAELTLYVILDDHLEKPWVFVIEPPRLGEIEPSIDVITSVDWEEEVSLLRHREDTYFSSLKKNQRTIAFAPLPCHLP